VRDAYEGLAVSVWRRFLPRRFEWVLFKTDSVPVIDIGDLAIEEVGPGQSLSPAQGGYLKSRIPAPTLYWMLRWQRRGNGWVFVAACDQKLCHYTFVTPARRYRRIFPMPEEEALLVGPSATDVEFRGRAIFKRVLAHVVHTLAERGHGPFYADTSVANTVSIRGIEKVGFQRCGVWAGKRWPLDLHVTSHRVSD
jgi:GNAT superfamily N-acetyltransferase